MRVLPIASGKGGVGKTLVATNLAIALAKYGKKVVLADLDLGASNLHLSLGQSGVKTGIGTFLNSSRPRFEDIILPTEYENLRFIPGDAEIPGMANLKSGQKAKLIRRLFTVEADYLVADLGAGTNLNTLDFFLTSSRGIVVTSPTLTATLNAYLFLKNTLFRVMNTSFRKGSAAHEYLESLRKDGEGLQRVYVPRLMERIRSEDPESYDRFQHSMKSFRPMLVMNMLNNPSDARKAEKIKRSCREYLGIEMEHLGVLYFDHMQEVALGSRIPITVYKPDSVLSQAIFRLADKIIQHGNQEDAGLIDIDRLDQSYETAEIEAEVDFDAREQDLENLLHSGVLTQGDLIDTIKAQQYDISSLKKENRFLKSKLLKAAEQGFEL
jgi:flagellar biosynthesis protein FlhG